MMTNHNFVVNDNVVFVDAFYSTSFTVGKEYVVLQTGFWSIKLLDDVGLEKWASPHAFQLVPRVTIVKKHMKRIVFGR